MGVTKEEVARIVEACAPVSPKMGLALAEELQAARAQLADQRAFGLAVAWAAYRAGTPQHDVDLGAIVDAVIASG